MALDPEILAAGKALVVAIARANRHPDPNGYADEVAAHFEANTAPVPTAEQQAAPEEAPTPETANG